MLANTKASFSWTLIALAATAEAQLQPACSSGIYSKLSPLSHFPPAQSFCSKFFPIPVTTTITSTTTSTETYTTTKSFCHPVSKRDPGTVQAATTTAAAAAAAALVSAEAYKSLTGLPGALASTFCSCIESPTAVTTQTEVSTATKTSTIVAPCATGQYCDASTPGGAVCRPDPNCNNPQACITFAMSPCDPSESCFCYPDPDDNGYCLGPAGCPADPVFCDANSECQAGEICLAVCCNTNQEAARPICLNAQAALCPDASSPSMLFRRIDGL